MLIVYCDILQPKSVLKSRKSEFDGYLDDDEAESSEESSHPNNPETEHNVRIAHVLLFTLVIENELIGISAGCAQFLFC